MSAELFLGVDIGTTVTKATIVDSAGSVIASSLRIHEGIRRRPGWHEHDPEEHWWRPFVELCRDLQRQLGDRFAQVGGIAASGLFPAFLPTDESGRALTAAILYDDDRSAKIAHDLRDELGARLYGNELIPRGLWFQSHAPEIWAATRRIFSAHSYLVYRLTGAYFTDTINAFVAGDVFDPGRGEWKQDKLARYGYSPDLLPSICAPSAVVGRVGPEQARLLGLRSGVPVLGGTGDTPMSLLGSGACRRGDVLVNYGSVGVMVGLTEDIEHTLDSVTLGDKGIGFQNLMILNQFGRQLDHLVVILGGGDDLESARARLEVASEKLSPTAERVLFRTYLPAVSKDLVMTTDPLADIVGLRFASSAAEIYRSALECFGFEVRRALGTHRPQYLCANGGGARSNLWRSIVTDIVAVPQCFIEDGAGAYGTALLAGHGCNRIDIHDALSRARSGALWVTPDDRRVGPYETRFHEYLGT